MVVQGWIDRSVPNFGLIHQGYDESADFKTDACLSSLSKFALDVSVVWDRLAPQLRVQNVSVTDKNGEHVCATGSITVATTIHNERDVGAATYDVLLEVDGMPHDGHRAPIGSYADRPETFLPNIDLSAGDHTLQVLVDADRNLNRIEDSLDVASLSVNCAQAAPTPTPKPAGLQVAAVEQIQAGHLGGVAHARWRGVLGMARRARLMYDTFSAAIQNYLLAQVREPRTAILQRQGELPPGRHALGDEHMPGLCV